MVYTDLSVDGFVQINIHVIDWFIKKLVKTCFVFKQVLTIFVAPACGDLDIVLTTSLKYVSALCMLCFCQDLFGP